MTHTTKNCGYDGGINKTHDIDLYEKSEFHRVHRVCNIDIYIFLLHVYIVLVLIYFSSFIIHKFREYRHEIKLNVIKTIKLNIL